jgi:mannose-1-phosphate guanylyltransferase
VERDTFPGLLADGAMVTGYLDNAYWLDLGTPAAFIRGSADLVLGRLSSSAVPRPGPALVLDDALVAADATLTDGSTIGVGAVVGSGAVVSGSVLQDGAWVGAGAVVVDSVLGAGARVGERTRLTGVVVGDGALVGADNELTTGARVWNEAVVLDATVRFSSDS